MAKVGSQGLMVSPQGLGCMGMSAFYGPPKPEGDMIELIRKAIDHGITFLDTADVYGPHTNEILVGKAIKGIREKVELCTKFAAVIEESGMNVRGDPGYIRAACQGSLERLGVDCIDLYYQHRVDPRVPIEISMGAMKELLEEGKIKYVGLSEASAADIRRAHAVVPITAVQIEYSLWSRDVEEEVIPTCRELGIGIVAYSPLGRGFFSGTNIAELSDDDFRRTQPRLSGENYDTNKRFYDKLVGISGGKKCRPGQLALAWVHHKGAVPIPGTTRWANLQENLESLGIRLSPDEVTELEEAVPRDAVMGDRYVEEEMQMTWRNVRSLPLDQWQG